MGILYDLQEELTVMKLAGKKVVAIDYLLKRMETNSLPPENVRRLIDNQIVYKELERLISHSSASRNERLFLERLQASYSPVRESLLNTTN